MKELPKNPSDWITKSTKTVYDNQWISVDHHEVQNPGGGGGIYGVVHFKNTAIGIIPIDAEGLITLVGQFRYPHKQYSWEIPEGGGSKEEDPLDAAKRELEEETGLTSNIWSKVFEMDLSNSASDERSIIFLAENCSPGQSSPEETEALALVKISINELYLRVESGEIRDSLTVAAAYWLKLNRGK
jgi:8-oxo-dGTP pyrophosphatase MutT (NUDIX family)